MKSWGWWLKTIETPGIRALKVVHIRILLSIFNKISVSGFIIHGQAQPKSGKSSSCAGAICSHIYALINVS